MFGWFKTLYASYHTVVQDIQCVIDDLDKIKKLAFAELNIIPVGDRIQHLRLLNQIIDSELSARRFKQAERRIQHGFILAVFTLIGGGLGVTALKMFG
jgi:hypothetical protein